MSRRGVIDRRMNVAERRRLCEQVRALRLPCAMCGLPIDQTPGSFRQRHPLASNVDEWIPRALGGDPLDPDNVVEMHKHCNGVKWKRWPVTQEMRDQCRQHIARLLGDGPTQPTVTYTL